MRVVHDRRRSRHEPDAITVEDLLSGQALDHEVTDPERLEPARVPREFLPPPSVRSRRAAKAHREPESTLSKVAKLAGLTTAAGLLVGAVVASSMVTRERTPTAGATPAPPQITGAAALGGFVPEAARSHQSTRDDHVQGGQAAPAGPQTETSSPAQSAASGTPSSASAAPTTTAHQRSDTERINLVREFYHRMGSQHPQDALAMLAPGLAGDEPGDLVRAWSSMDQIHVDDAEVQPDGTVRAVVTMRQHDGTELRVTQVLSLADEATGAITQAVLLSAEQL
ncbi:MAG TPA: hypothetical protein VHC18_02950 [Amycolatopsis sp.]|nr:hypothetical protein [Amycolatopsis sp.]